VKIRKVECPRLDLAIISVNGSSFIFISCRSFHKYKSCTSNKRNHCNSYTNVSNAATNVDTVTFTNKTSKATTNRVTRQVEAHAQHVQAQLKAQANIHAQFQTQF